MSTKVKRVSPNVALTRLLDALEQDLRKVSDEEIVEVAKDLGMDPTMRESAAFLGVTYPAKPQLSDFFEFEAQVGMDLIGSQRPVESSKRKLRHARRAQIRTEKKVPREK